MSDELLNNFMKSYSSLVQEENRIDQEACSTLQTEIDQLNQQIKDLQERVATKETEKQTRQMKIDTKDYNTKYLNKITNKRPVDAAAVPPKTKRKMDPELTTHFYSHRLCFYFVESKRKGACGSNFRKALNEYLVKYGKTYKDIMYKQSLVMVSEDKSETLILGHKSCKINGCDFCNNESLDPSTAMIDGVFNHFADVDVLDPSK